MINKPEKDSLRIYKIQRIKYKYFKYNLLSTNDKCVLLFNIILSLNITLFSSSFTSNFTLNFSQKCLQKIITTAKRPAKAPPARTPKIDVFVKSEVPWLLARLDTTNDLSILLNTCIKKKNNLFEFILIEININIT